MGHLAANSSRIIIEYKIIFLAFKIQFLAPLPTLNPSYDASFIAVKYQSY